MTGPRTSRPCKTWWQRMHFTLYTIILKSVALGRSCLPSEANRPSCNPDWYKVILWVVQVGIEFFFWTWTLFVLRIRAWSDWPDCCFIIITHSQHKPHWFPDGLHNRLRNMSQMERSSTWVWEWEKLREKTVLVNEFVGLNPIHAWEILTDQPEFLLSQIMRIAGT